MGEWYYIGHYGQLGPLTREQIDDLVVGGVIGRDTYVWRNGMSDWVFAERCGELAVMFARLEPTVAPPPPSPGPYSNPAFSGQTFSGPSYTGSAPASSGSGSAAGFSTSSAAQEPPRVTVAIAGAYDYTLRQPNAFYPSFGRLKSDRSRTAAGILQLIIPGVGRMYLGFLAYGVIQLALTIVTCGLLWIWSFIDGIIILTGGVKYDGYGRELSE